ncbi:MAG: heavy-metal-associated domain-containing protein [Acidimicrobiales bacterium]
MRPSNHSPPELHHPDHCPYRQPEEKTTDGYPTDGHPRDRRRGAERPRHLLCACAHCNVTIEKGLGGAPGVGRVEVDVDTKAVRVTCDRAVTDQDDLRVMLADLGYPTT